jgi:hypothetical protein
VEPVLPGGLVAQGAALKTTGIYVRLERRRNAKAVLNTKNIVAATG